MQKSLSLSFHGEPNRVCDILAEMLVEEYTKKDATTRCRLSVFGSEGMIMVAGSVQSQAEIDIAHLIKEHYKQITGKEDLEPFVHIQQENTKGFEVSQWSNQEMGVAYGFATSQTQENIPHILQEAHNIRRRTEDARLADPECHFLGHGGRLVITAEGKKIESLQLSVEHLATVTQSDVKQVVYDRIIQSAFQDAENMKIEITGTPHDKSGFSYSSGASGVDVDAIMYGGMIPRASHAFTGMDIYAPARLATYESRRLAKHLLKGQGGEGSILVQLPYAENKILVNKVRAFNQVGEDISEKIRRERKAVDTLVELFDLRKAPLRLMAEHHIFIPELAPWEILHEEL